VSRDDPELILKVGNSSTWLALVRLGTPPRSSSTSTDYFSSQPGRSAQSELAIRSQCAELIRALESAAAVFGVPRESALTAIGRERKRHNRPLKAPLVQSMIVVRGHCCIERKPDTSSAVGDPFRARKMPHAISFLPRKPGSGTLDQACVALMQQRPTSSGSRSEGSRLGERFRTPPDRQTQQCPSKRCYRAARWTADAGARGH
jgi:hypothetical protein